MTRHFKFVLTACAALGAAAASAETLPVNGIYPAGNDRAAELGVIAVDRFGGSDGQQLGIAIADRLRGVVIEGRPYLRVLPSLSDEADAILQGTATAEAGRRDSGTREDEVCVERDEDRKCIRREKRKIPCWDHLVRLDASVRLIGVDGEPMHGFDRGDELSQRYCEGDSRPSTEAMVRQLISTYADSARSDLAPVERNDDIRVMESREGLSGDDSRAFRDAVRAVERDPAAACAAWAGLETTHPQHRSVLFNLGLCAESRGDLDEAYQYYGRVLSIDDDTDYARQGLYRLEQRARADAQLAAQRRR